MREVVPSYQIANKRVEFLATPKCSHEPLERHDSATFAKTGLPLVRPTPLHHLPDDQSPLSGQCVLGSPMLSLHWLHLGSGQESTSVGFRSPG